MLIVIIIKVTGHSKHDHTDEMTHLVLLDLDSMPTFQKLFLLVKTNESNNRSEITVEYRLHTNEVSIVGKSTRVQGSI